MAGENLPLILIRSTWFVQDLLWYVELADVMQQGRPSKLLKVFTANTHLLGDHLRVRAHPFRMASGQSIMMSNSLDHGEHLLAL